MTTGKEKPRVLLVSPDLPLRENIRWSLSEYEMLTAENRVRAIAQFRRFEPSVVLLDWALLGDRHSGVTESLLLLEEILALNLQTKVILLVNASERSAAIQAIRSGAYDFQFKPIELDVIKLTVGRALHLCELERSHSQSTISLKPSIHGLLYSSSVMERTCKMVEKVAHTNASVLLLGESGSGKEVLARGIHQMSPRAKERFVAINCAAIPESLLESELFGYEKGAFTGANKQTLGKIELAHKGTLFLDEIGDLPLALQPKLLRFLQEKTIERLGGREEIALDVRVICATHQPLKQAGPLASFREDLYYRIGEVVIPIPPLRERDQDVLLLAKAFLSRFNTEFNRRLKGFQAEALAILEAHHWPGNIRELENCIKRAVIMAETPLIRPEDLDIHLVTRQKVPLNLRHVRDQAESEAISRALEYVDGNVSKAAELLGVTRPTLYNLMDKLSMRQKEPS